MKRLFALAALAAAVTLACSSAPKKQDEVFDQKNKAAEAARFGNDYYRRGDLDQAARFFALSLAYNAAADNRAGLAESYNSLGKVHLARGANEEAVRHFGQALRIGQDLGDGALAAKAQNNLGEAAFARSEFAAALELFVTAGGGRGLADGDRAVVLHNQGAALRRLGRPAEAEPLLREALAINTRGRTWEEAASNCYVLAALEAERGALPRAREFAALALENDRKVENSRGIAKDYVALGRIASRAGEAEAALDFFERAVLVYKSLAVVDARVDVRGGLEEAATAAAQTADGLGRAEVARSYRALLQGGGSPR